MKSNFPESTESTTEEWRKMLPLCASVFNNLVGATELLHDQLLRQDSRQLCHVCLRRNVERLFQLGNEANCLPLGATSYLRTLRQHYACRDLDAVWSGGDDDVKIINEQEIADRSATQRHQRQLPLLQQQRQNYQQLSISNDPQRSLHHLQHCDSHLSHTINVNSSVRPHVNAASAFSHIFPSSETRNVDESCSFRGYDEFCSGIRGQSPGHFCHGGGPSSTGETIKDAGIRQSSPLHHPEIIPQQQQQQQQRRASPGYGGSAGCRSSTLPEMSSHISHPLDATCLHRQFNGDFSPRSQPTPSSSSSAASRPPPCATPAPTGRVVTNGEVSASFLARAPFPSHVVPHYEVSRPSPTTRRSSDSGTDSAPPEIGSALSAGGDHPRFLNVPSSSSASSSSFNYSPFPFSRFLTADASKQPKELAFRRFPGDVNHHLDGGNRSIDQQTLLLQRLVTPSIIPKDGDSPAAAIVNCDVAAVAPAAADDDDDVDRSQVMPAPPMPPPSWTTPTLSSDGQSNAAIDAAIEVDTLMQTLDRRINLVDSATKRQSSVLSNDNDSSADSLSSALHLRGLVPPGLVPPTSVLRQGPVQRGMKSVTFADGSRPRDDCLRRNGSFSCPPKRRANDDSIRNGFSRNGNFSSVCQTGLGRQKPPQLPHYGDLFWSQLQNAAVGTRSASSGLRDPRIFNVTHHHRADVGILANAADANPKTHFAPISPTACQINVTNVGDKCAESPPVAVAKSAATPVEPGWMPVCSDDEASTSTFEAIQLVVSTASSSLTASTTIASATKSGEEQITGGDSLITSEVIEDSVVSGSARDGELNEDGEDGGDHDADVDAEKRESERGSVEDSAKECCTSNALALSDDSTMAEGNFDEEDDDSFDYDATAAATASDATENSQPEDKRVDSNRVDSNSADDSCTDAEFYQDASKKKKKKKKKKRKAEAELRRDESGGECVQPVVARRSNSFY